MAHKVKAVVELVRDWVEIYVVENFEIEVVGRLRQIGVLLPPLHTEESFEFKMQQMQRRMGIRQRRGWCNTID